MKNKLKYNILVFVSLFIMQQSKLFSFSFVHKDCPFKEIFSSPSHAINGIKLAYKLYFNGVNDEQWSSQALGNSTESVNCLGYDLKLEYIYENSVTQNKTTTLYLHGWGDTKNSARILKKFCKVIDDNVVTFNFPDARPIIGKLKQSSFGQLSDILTAIYAAHCAIKELNLQSLNLFGISRGGATVINMIALLNNQELFKTHEKELSKIGIDEQARQRILQAIQNGTIILDIPLRSMKHTPIPHYLLQKMTAYKRNEWEPLAMVKHLSGLNLKVLVHFQHNDAIISNKHEAEFFYDLASRNPQTYLVMGNEGGHIHSHASLNKTATIFKSITNMLDENDVLTICSPEQCAVNGVLMIFDQPTLELIKKSFEYYHQSQPGFFKNLFQRFKKV